LDSFLFLIKIPKEISQFLISKQSTHVQYAYIYREEQLLLVNNFTYDSSTYDEFERPPYIALFETLNVQPGVCFVSFSPKSPQIITDLFCVTHTQHFASF